MADVLTHKLILKYFYLMTQFSYWHENDTNKLQIKI